MGPKTHGRRFGPPRSGKNQNSGDDWMGTYADAITLLMAFFVILLSTAKIDEAKYAKVANAIAQDLQHKKEPEAQPVAAPVSADEIAFESKLASRLEPLNKIENVAVETAKDSLTIEFSGGLLYASGSAELKKSAIQTLRDVSQALGDVDLNEYMITVEGHTDATPVVRNNTYPTNWKLSTGRANAVRGRLESVGVDQNRIRVEGYADTVPLPESDLMGLSDAERLARHRRVVVRIY